MPDEPTLIAQAIDHTLLTQDATKLQILTLCEEAKRYRFASVCVNPYWVPLVTEILDGTPVNPCTVIGFPLGATSTAAKAFEAQTAAAAGAKELDMVLNIGALKSHDDTDVALDIETVADAVHAYDARLKVIIESSILSADEIVRACNLAVESGTDFVKTSTGMFGNRASTEAVAIMRATVGPDIGVKASGGIRDYATATAMLEAGASRLGASASVAIVEAAAKSHGKSLG